MKHVAAFLLSLSVLPVCHAQTQTFPNAPVRIIVPFSPGGTTDILARIMADGMSAFLKTSVVVENRAGATGMIGAEAVVRAAPDGYTLGIATVSSHSVNPVVRKLSFDVERDLTPVVNIANSPTVLVVRPDLPARTFAELIDAAKQNPGALTFGIAGLGSEGHLKSRLLYMLTGADFLPVPYKGLSAALQDAMGGRVDVVLDDLPSSLPYITTGRLRAVAVASPQRLPVMPDVPTYAEVGLPEMNINSWFGIVAPARTPPEIIAKLNAAANAALRTERTAQAIRKLSVEPAGGSPEDFGRTMNTHRAIQRQVAEKANIQLD